MSHDPFLTYLKLAHDHLRSSITILNDAVAMPQARMLQPQERNLLQQTRIRLRRQTATLHKLTIRAYQDIDPHTPLPAYLVGPATRHQYFANSQSPDKRPPGRSD